MGDVRQPTRLSTTRIRATVRMLPRGWVRRKAGRRTCPETSVTHRWSAESGDVPHGTGVGGGHHGRVGLQRRGDLSLAMLQDVSSLDLIDLSVSRVPTPVPSPALPGAWWESLESVDDLLL